MPRNQTYFGPQHPTLKLVMDDYVEVTDGASATVGIVMLNGKIEYRGSSGPKPDASLRGTPMVEGDVMIKRPIADLFGDPTINRVFVKAIEFQSEILVDTTDA